MNTVVSTRQHYNYSQILPFFFLTHPSRTKQLPPCPSTFFFFFVSCITIFTHTPLLSITMKKKKGNKGYLLLNKLTDFLRVLSTEDHNRSNHLSRSRMICQEGTSDLKFSRLFELLGFDEVFGTDIEAAGEGFGVCEIPGDDNELVLCCVRRCYVC